MTFHIVVLLLVVSYYIFVFLVFYYFYYFISEKIAPRIKRFIMNYRQRQQDLNFKKRRRGK